MLWCKKCRAQLGAAALFLVMIVGSFFMLSGDRPGLSRALGWMQTGCLFVALACAVAACVWKIRKGDG